VAQGPKKKAWYRQLWVQVLIGMGVGVLLGHLAPQTGESMKPLGDAFIKLIKMIIAPIIFVTVVAGLAKMSNMKEFGRIGVRAVIIFEVISTLALVVGLAVGILVRPGAGLNADPASLDAGAVSAYASRSASAPGSVEFFMNVIPETVVGAFATGYILQVLFFSILFGLALLRLGEKGRPLMSLIETLSAAMFAAICSLNGLSLGACAITVASTLTTAQRTAINPRTRRKRRRLSMSLKSSAVSGKCSPMSPRPAAPSSASHTACSSTSASECPASPRS